MLPADDGAEGGSWAGAGGVAGLSPRRRNVSLSPDLELLRLKGMGGVVDFYDDDTDALMEPVSLPVEPPSSILVSGRLRPPLSPCVLPLPTPCYWAAPVVRRRLKRG
jgi:hypothetical protein